MGFIKTFMRAAIRQKQIERKADQKKQWLAEKIRGHAKEQSQQLLKIIADCAELVNTTVNPDVFFSRYNLMLEHLETLAGFECTGIFDNSHELPSETFLRVEAQFEAATNEFLNRSFEAAKSHADSLKTESGKKNAIKRYFENMENYISRMSGESKRHFRKMQSANLEQHTQNKKNVKKGQT